MNTTEWTNLLKTRNAKIKGYAPPINALNAGYVSEISSRLSFQGATPALFDYPQGTVIANALTTSAPTSTFDLGKHQVAQYVAVRFVTTIGATPTATFDIQGSTDSSGGWQSLNFADSSAPTTYTNSTFVVTTATTIVKYLQFAQKIRYIRVNVTSNTNVTYTIDVTPL